MMWLAALALVLEGCAGYPAWLYQRVRHPVVWVGAWIRLSDTLMNRAPHGQRARKLLGCVLLASLLLIGVAAGLIAHQLGSIVEVLFVASLLAGKSLHTHVAAVALALNEGVQQGRLAVGKIVGRDTAPMQEADICRATVESLAENTSDGLVAPLFWYMLAGPCAIAAYKAVSTADSMVGYRNERYGAFGWASARTDDLLNLIPARLTALLFAASTLSYQGFRRAWGTALAHARRHASPNAGWPEAAMAGALGVQLGGTAYRDGRRVEGPTLGTGRYELTINDIHLALRLYTHVRLILLALVVGLAWVWPT